MHMVTYQVYLIETICTAVTRAPLTKNPQLTTECRLSSVSGHICKPEVCRVRRPLASGVKLWFLIVPPYKCVNAVVMRFVTGTLHDSNHYGEQL